MLPVFVEIMNVSLGVDTEAAVISHSSIYHKYTTLNSPNKAETAVSGSAVFFRITGEAVTGYH